MRALAQETVVVSEISISNEQQIPVTGEEAEDGTRIKIKTYRCICLATISTVNLWHPFHQITEHLLCTTQSNGIFQLRQSF